MTPMTREEMKNTLREAEALISKVQDANREPLAFRALAAAEWALTAARELVKEV